MAENTSAPRRGRPRSFDKDEVLQQVQEAFWKGGFEGTSIGDLTGATGLNRPSLYGAFGDKHTLYIHALQQYREGMHAAGRKILEDAPTLRTALEDLFRAAIRIYTDDEEAARIASAVLHSLSVRARAGASKRALHALAQSAVDLLTKAPETGRSEGR